MEHLVPARAGQPGCGTYAARSTARAPRLGLRLMLGLLRSAASRPPWETGAWMRSGSGAFIDGSAAQTRIVEGRGQVGLVERADGGAGRDDLVDLVEDVVGERDVGGGEQVVELLHRVRPDDRAGHAGMGDRERYREVRHRQAGLLSERDELLDRVDPALVVEVPENVRSAQVGLLALAD